MGLTKTSGGGGVNAELIFNTCETNVGSFGIQFAITMRPPGLVTRTISLATSKGLGANMAPNTERTRSNEWSATPFQIACVPLLKLQLTETRFRGSPASGFNEV